MKPESASPQPRAEKEHADWGFIEFFSLAQLVLPAVLYIPGTQAFRVPIRVAPFGLSLAALAWVQIMGQNKRSSPSHPARPWLMCALAYLVVMIFHPTTNTLLAGLAQVTLYLSVMAPLFWAAYMLHDTGQIARILTILLYCNGINAVVGLLQVYYPDAWLPKELSRVQLDLWHGNLQALTYMGPGGRLLMRPPGLSDNPGAACGPAMNAALLGAIFALAPVTPFKKALALGFAGIGIAVLLLTQVRTSLLILLGMAALYLGRMLMSRYQVRAVIFLFLFLILGASFYQYAINLGGEAIQQRFETLLAKDPLSVYYDSSRGGHLEQGFKQYLVDYPLGAGLARWGMMRYYFGDPQSLDSSVIWVELQMPGWIIDGGVVLLFLYTMALIVATRHDLRWFKAIRDPTLKFWSAAVFALNAGTFCLIFGYTPFTTQVGLQYWLLTGAINKAGFLSRQSDEKLPAH